MAHGAAGSGHHFMQTIADRLAEHHIATLRFNFPFMENGGAPAESPKAQSHPPPSRPPLKHAKGPTLPAGGKSFGGRT
ncbi:MAG: alpha/beta family hydrolase [Bacteroidia bacterium]